MIKKDEKIYEYIKIKEDEERTLKQLEREQKLKVNPHGKSKRGTRRKLPENIEIVGEIEEIN